MVRYILPSVGTLVKRERHCPNCERYGGNIHTSVRFRRISDMKVNGVRQQRMHCPWCGTTWTVRASGVQAGRQRSDRVRGLAVMLYMLGLSYRNVEEALSSLDCIGSKSSVERDVSEAGQKARSLHEQSPGLRIRVLGVDGTGAALAGRSGGMLFFVDVDGQRLLRVEPIREVDVRQVRCHVRRVMATVRAEELRTDELSVYDHTISQERHRICQAHWLKSKGKRTYDLLREAIRDQRLLEVESLRQLQQLLRLKPRPSHPPEELQRLVRRYINCRSGFLWKINQLLQHIERTWEKVSDDPIDPTNNATERIIGLTFKIRAKTMRGFKAQAKVLNHIYLSDFLHGKDRICHLKDVI